MRNLHNFGDLHNLHNFCIWKTVPVCYPGISRDNPTWLSVSPGLGYPRITFFQKSYPGICNSENPRMGYAGISLTRDNPVFDRISRDIPLQNLRTTWDIPVLASLKEVNQGMLAYARSRSLPKAPIARTIIWIRSCKLHFSANCPRCGGRRLERGAPPRPGRGRLRPGHPEEAQFVVVGNDVCRQRIGFGEAVHTTCQSNYNVKLAQPGLDLHKAMIAVCANCGNTVSGITENRTWQSQPDLQYISLLRQWLRPFRETAPQHYEVAMVTM